MTPLREPHEYPSLYSTPREQFRFVGDGPYWDFTWYPWMRFSVSEVWNFFHAIGAEVTDHRSEKIVGDKGRIEPEQADRFVVKWHLEGRE